MITVVAVLLILSLIYLPRLASNTQGIMDTRKSLHLLASDLRYTRRLAMTASTNYKLQISTDTTPVTYQILRASDSAQVDTPREIPSTVAASGATAVTFVATGGATTNSTVTLTGPRNTYNVIVFSATGSTQIQKVR